VSNPSHCDTDHDRACTRSLQALVKQQKMREQYMNFETSRPKAVFSREHPNVVNVLARGMYGGVDTLHVSLSDSCGCV